MQVVWIFKRSLHKVLKNVNRLAKEKQTKSKLSVDATH